MAGLSVVLFYLCTISALLLVSALTFSEVLLVIVFARFGAAFLLLNTLKDHAEIMQLFFQSFWFRKGAEFQIPLVRADAPALFSMIEELASKTQVPVPDEVLLGMNMNAWVKLKGLRRGGRSTLGLGYDLLSGLDLDQLRAVLAHEFTHARLVQRGHRRVVTFGLSHAIRLAGGLWSLKERLIHANRPSEVCRLCHRLADLFARWIVTLVAACSRQDEFDADRGSVELCGVESARSALLQVERLAEVTARLPWDERVAQLQAGRPLSEWLQAELSASKPRSELAVTPFNKYSTHPSLKDRLAALPAFLELGGQNRSSESAILLLSDPRGVAERSLAEILKVVAQEEEKDSQRLRRWSRQQMTSSHLRPIQLVGAAIGIVGTAVGISLMPIASFSVGVWVLFISWAVGAVVHRLGGYREKVSLPVPPFKLVKEAARQSLDEKAAEQEGAMRREFRELVAGIVRKSERKTRLTQLAYEALKACDYLRAHAVASNLIELDKNSVEGALALVISAAACGFGQEVQTAFQTLRKQTRLKGFSVSWGTAWALTLCGDSAAAEPFLERALGYSPGQSTLLTLLALSRSRRGKLQSAILSARQACDCATPDLEGWKLLLDLLLNAGYSREAAEHLERLSKAAPADREVLLLQVRLCLLLRDFERVETHLEQLREQSLTGYELLDLGRHYEHARKHAEAAALYHEALGIAHYPEALLGLGRIEAERQNKTSARNCMLEALDMSRELGDRARGPLSLFNSIAGHLVSLEDPAPNCRAWIAEFDSKMKPAAFANTSLLVYAPELAQAQAFLHRILEAAEPKTPPVIAQSLNWRPAPPERQPEIPVRPGVQCVLN